MRERIQVMVGVLVVLALGVGVGFGLQHLLRWSLGLWAGILMALAILCFWYGLSVRHDH